MIKHMILWKLKAELSPEQKQAAKQAAKQALEGLRGKIDGLLEIKVHINGLESSNADMMLDSSFTDEQALKGYQVHPAHQAAANDFVRPVTEQRLCLDFEL